MKLGQFQTLSKAFDMMLDDNVANDQIKNQIRNKAHSVELDPEPLFSHANTELSTIDPKALVEVCCGEIDENIISNDTQDCLSILFDMIH